MKTSIVRTARFYAARVFAFFFRIASLRVARFTFKNAQPQEVLHRSFYGSSLNVEVARGGAQQLLWLQGRRFVKERHLLEKLVMPGDIGIDVGANIGYYALIIAHRLHGRGSLICMEPEPDNLRELRLNITSNGLDRLVTIKPCAAGAYDGELRFEQGLNGRADPHGSLSVSVIKIDSLNLPRVDFIKIDVEGYEGAVLAGAINTIESHKPALFLELHPTLLTNQSHREIIRLLEDHYPCVRAFRARRGNALMRGAMAYLPFIEETEPCNIDEVVEQFANTGTGEPCWILARN